MSKQRLINDDAENLFYSYDDMCEETFDEKELSVEQITEKQLKLFIKENKELIKNVKLNSKKDWVEDAEIFNQYKSNLFKIKDLFNNILTDTYYDYKQINKLLSLNSYLKFGSNKLNKYITEKILKQ